MSNPAPRAGGTDERVAGLELDAEIALRVLGWHGPVVWMHEDDSYGTEGFAFPPQTNPSTVEANNREWDCVIPRFSTDIDAALDIVSALRERGITLNVASGDNAPLAICIAALKAVEAQDA